VHPGAREENREPGRFRNRIALREGASSFLQQTVHRNRDQACGDEIEQNRGKHVEDAALLRKP